MYASLRYPICQFLLFAVLASSATSQIPNKSIGTKAQDLNSSAASPQYQILNVGNISLWAHSDGLSPRSPKGNNAGVFPRGTANILYADGFVWGGKVFLDASKTIPAVYQHIRVGGGTYGSGTRRGRIIGGGASAVSADTSSPEARYFRIRRDYKKMTTEELRRDAAESYEVPLDQVTQIQMDEILAQYQKDWNEWPVEYGAPYVERNEIPGFQLPPAFSSIFTADSLVSGKHDEPGIAGANASVPADQVMWTVYNDLDSVRTVSFSKSWPMGLELQQTTWAYKGSEALKNIVFRRLKMINRGGVEVGTPSAPAKGSFWIDSMYVLQWSDGDLGSFSDDLDGCDTILGLGYYYNGYNSDDTYRNYSLPPPAFGYDVIQGPRVTFVGDSAIFDLKRILGWKNLPVTSIQGWGSGDPYSDPAGEYPTKTGRWWKVLRGFAPLGDMTSSDQYFYNGPSLPTKFPKSGDPVTGTGFLDGMGTSYSFAPGDRRVMVSSGPFSLAPGDTQEVVIAIVAGLGSDRLSSIATMRQVDNVAQAMHNSLYSLSSPPKVSAEVSYPTPSQAAVKIVADARSSQISTLSAALKKQDGSLLANVELFDDGVHGDISAGDGIFANSFTLPREPSGIVIDANVTDMAGYMFTFPKAAEFVTTVGALRAITPVVISDNLNNDGKANPGENVRFAFTVQNTTADTITALKMVATSDFELGKILTVTKVLSNSSLYFPSDVNNAQSYFSLAVPSTYSDSAFKVEISMFDQRNNRWKDTISLPVVPLSYPIRYSTISHVKGKADGSFDVRVVDPTLVKNHLYVILGADSEDTNGNRRITLKDSTDGRILFLDHLLPDTLGHNMPVTDGFKVLRGSILDVQRAGMKDWFVRKGTRRITFEGAQGMGFEGFFGSIGWGDPAHYFNGLPRAVSPSQLKNVLLVWAQGSAKTNVPADNGSNPYAGWDENTVTDPNMSYAYRYLRAATSPAARPEFAPYILNPSASYAYQDYKKSVPLAVFDTESNPPARLTVGFLENNVVGGLVDGKYYPPSNLSGVDNALSAGPREWLFIFNSAYTASTPSPLFQQTILTTSLPVMWWCVFNRRNNNLWDEPTGTNEFEILAAHVVTSEDRWVFNPTILLGIEDGNVPTSYELAQNYPNPFNPSTKIEFEIATTTTVSLRIYNLLGQEIATLVNERMNSGHYTRDWNGRNNGGILASSGVYFYRLVAGGFVQTKKMILLR